MINALTIDVEDYFHVNAFAGRIRPDEWPNYPLRVGDNVRRILDLLDACRVRATFFVLGWVAERLPRLVREIHERGHEIASHGYGHQLVYTLTPREFRQDIALTKALLEGICGRQVLGYRAPSYSITRRSTWAFDVLAEEGYRYDSSIFPICHDVYGIPGGERFVHDIATSSGLIREIPLTTFEIGPPGWRLRVPVAGGGYLRLLPARFVAGAIESINRREHQPAIVYFHPWELDPGQPRIKAGLASRFRHYINLERTERKVRFLLERFSFSTAADVYNLKHSTQRGIAHEPGNSAYGIGTPFGHYPAAQGTVPA